MYLKKGYRYGDRSAISCIFSGVLQTLDFQTLEKSFCRIERGGYLPSLTLHENLDIHIQIPPFPKFLLSFPEVPPQLNPPQPYLTFPIQRQADGPRTLSLLRGLNHGGAPRLRYARLGEGRSAALMLSCSWRGCYDEEVEVGGRRRMLNVVLGDGGGLVTVVILFFLPW